MALATVDELGVDYGEQLLASAVRFLIDGNEYEAARLLLPCTPQVEREDCTCGFGSWHTAWKVTLRCPRASYDVLSDRDHPAAKTVERALAAVLPGDDHLYDWRPYVRAEVIGVDPNWRAEIAELVRGASINNQLAVPPI